MLHLLSKASVVRNVFLATIFMVISAVLSARSVVAAVTFDHASALTFARQTVAEFVDSASRFELAAQTNCHGGSDGSREVALSEFRNLFRTAVAVDAVVLPLLERGDGRPLIVVPVETNHDVREFISVLAKKEVRPEISTTQSIHEKSEVGLVLIAAEAFRLATEEQDQSYCGVMQLSIAALLERGRFLRQMIEALPEGRTTDAKIKKRLVTVLAAGLENTRRILFSGRNAQSLSVFDGLVPRTAQVVFRERIRALSVLNAELDLEGQLPPGRFWMKNLAGQYWRVLEASDGTGGRAYGYDKDVNVNLKHVIRTLSDLRDLIAVDMAGAAGVGRIEGFGRKG